MKDLTEGERRLRKAKRGVEAWRARHGGRGRMPNALWEQAADAAAVCGVEDAAARLQLGLRPLNAWLDRRNRDSATRCESSFVEIPMSFPISSECVLEMSGANGQTLRVRLTGDAIGQAPALVGIALGGAVA